MAASEGDHRWSLSNPSTVDLNGDGTSDIVWRNDQTGAVEAWSMRSCEVAGAPERLPDVTDAGLRVRGVADYDRDGSPDLLLHDMRTGELFIRGLRGTSLTHVFPTPPNLDWKVGGVQPN